MTEKLILAVDLGTSGMKVALITISGKVLGWEAEQVALPVRTIRPRNLRLGVFRGGRRPLDLYRRIHAGINGTPMPGVGPATPGAKGTLSEEEIWQIVDYVQSLPFEPASEPPESLLNARERL